MKQYAGLSLISAGSGGIHIHCSDADTLEWIFSELQQRIPTCSIQHERKDLEGKRCYMMLNRLGGKDWEAYAWLRRIICENGWQPFAVLENSEQFRKTIIK